MNAELCAEAIEFGSAARKAFEAAGGFEAGDAAVAALDGLGAWDLDVRAGADELEAAAALCRAAGWWAVAHPVAERLARPADADALVVVAPVEPAVPSGTLDWKAVEVGSGDADVPLGLVLPCWTLLGMLDRAMDLTCAYVNERQQFGQPLAGFQGVQFQLTDAEVERVGLEELAKYALWSVQTRRPDALADALALRVAAIEAAEVVFRICHQLHGAIGFCDETALSWISRRSQPLRRSPLGLSATRDELTRVLGRHGLAGLFRVSAELDDFRAEVRAWCAEHVPVDWRAAQTGVDDDAFFTFQQAWFQELRGAGYAVPHWPEAWGGGMPVAQQAVLYQELAAADAPRLVLQFVSIHHAASTLLAAGTEEQRQRHLPAILEGEIWCQGFSEPEAGSDLAALRTTARREGAAYIVNGQKLWASGARHAGWCLLLARTDPDAPKRKGISYFLLDMASPGVDVRPIRNAVGESHFCEIFLDDVVLPAENLIGAENAGWQVAQETLGAERGLTMLELAERLANGFRWLVELCRPVLDDDAVADRLAGFEIELTALRSLCRGVVTRAEAGTVGPVEPSIVKLAYSELLQRLTGFGAEVAGLAAHTQLQKPLSSGWESGTWMLDFIGSWEWTIPGGSSEIQRNIIGERGLGLPREPA